MSTDLTLPAASPFDAGPISQLPEHRRADDWEGYLYVIEMSTGIVKVGRTRNPRGRITTHADNANRFGAEITNIWLSPRHKNYAKNETALIRALGTAESGTEYFRVKYADAVKIAAALTFHPLTEAERREREERSQESVKRLTDSLFGDHRAVSVSNAEDLIFVRKGVSRWPLQAVLGVELPQVDLSPAGDLAKTTALIERLSQATDIPAAEIWDWSYIDFLRHLCKIVIDTECWYLELTAQHEGRTDLLDPVFAPDIPNVAAFIAEATS